VVDHLGLVLGSHAGDQPHLLGLGDAQAVIGALDVFGQVLPGVGLLLGRAHEVLDAVEVDTAEVGAPGRHGLALVELERLEPQVQHPLRLALQCGNVPHDVGVDAAARKLADGVGVVPPVLVGAECL
jgi:hypothetical protein